MAIDAKSLADGQVAAAKATIYTCPVGTKAYIKSVVFSNVGVATETVKFYVKRSGSSSRQFARAVLLVQESLHAVDKDSAITLSDGDVLEASTTNATSVDYLVTGAEEA